MGSLLQSCEKHEQNLLFHVKYIAHSTMQKSWVTPQTFVFSKEFLVIFKNGLKQ